MAFEQQPPVIQPPDPIEREPPGWSVLPIAIAVVVVFFFILIPWLLLGWTR